MSAPAEHRYDAVVIGAGNGGMAAACQIAVGGKSVLLLEQHNIVGGFSTSFVRGRFEFEASLHELCELGTAADKGILYRMFEDLGIDVDWIRVPEAYRLLVPGGENDRIDAILPFGIDEYVEAVEGYCPGSRESVRRFFELAGEMCDAMVYVQDLQTDIGTLSKPYMLRHYPNFLKAGAYTVEEVFEALAMPKRAREILSAYWCYLGVPLDRMDFAFYGYMVYEYIKRGAYIPRYRSTEFAQAFEKRIRQCGGDVWCGVKAEKVLVENGRVTGVITDQGQRILTKQVVCNASPYHLYSEMISPAEAVPKQALREIGGRTPSVSGFVIFIGLDRTADELGINEYSYFIYDTMDTGALYKTLSQPGRPSMQATLCLNRAIPDCSPPGTTIMSFTVLPKPEAWKGVAEEDYFKMKSKMAQNVIEDFEKAAGITLRPHIEEIEIATPVTYAHYANAYQGLIYGFETCGWDGILPRVMMMEEDQHIKGLRVASAYGSRSLGYSSAMLNGRTMGLYALKDLAGAEGVKK